MSREMVGETGGFESGRAHLASLRSETPGPADGGGSDDAVDLIARAAHELRTPLTTIAGFATTLCSSRHRMSQAELDNSFAILKRQTERLCTLLDELLALGRYHHAVPARTPVDLADVIAGALEVSPPPQHVKVTIAGDRPGVPLVVAADRATVTRVAVNLLTNAYRYGGPNIAIGAYNDGASVALSVEDDGSGVPSALGSSVFAPFVQGENDNSTDKGSGLGLALARGIAESFGGDLTHEPVRPHGARFTMTLPAATSIDTRTPTRLVDLSATARQPVPDVDIYIDVDVDVGIGENPSPVPLPWESRCASP